MRLWADHGGPQQARGTLRRDGETGSARSSAAVLVVDDDASIVEVVSAILTAEGFQVMTAPGGAEALALLTSFQPALVLLDMRMPVVDGWAVARTLRERGSTVPIVVMTAADNARRWADEIGAAGHLAKPFGFDELVACVERYGTRRN